MNHAVAQASVHNDSWELNAPTQLVWVWQALWLVLIVSMFALVYMNFAIRVNTAKLNVLMRQNSRLQVERDSMLLEREKLQMHHRTEKKAKDVLGYRLAKNTKVVKITV